MPIGIACRVCNKTAVTPIQLYSSHRYAGGNSPIRFISRARALRHSCAAPHTRRAKLSAVGAAVKQGKTLSTHGCDHPKIRSIGVACDDNELPVCSTTHRFRETSWSPQLPPARQPQLPPSSQARYCCAAQVVQTLQTTSGSCGGKRVDRASTMLESASLGSLGTVGCPTSVPPPASDPAGCRQSRSYIAHGHHSRATWVADGTPTCS